MHHSDFCFKSSVTSYYTIIYRLELVLVYGSFSQIISSLATATLGGTDGLGNAGVLCGAVVSVVICCEVMRSIDLLGMACITVATMRSIGTVVDLLEPCLELAPRFGEFLSSLTSVGAVGNRLRLRVDDAKHSK